MAFSLAYKIKKGISIFFTFFLALPLFSFQEGNTSQQLYEKGLDILENEGVAAATAYFVKTGSKNGNAAALFGLGWSRWRAGDLGQAQMICQLMLNMEEEIPSSIAANVHYLQGHIFKNSSDPEKAIEPFETAARMYREQNRWEDEVKTLQGLAATYINVGDFEFAENILDSISNRDDPKVTAGFFYDLKSRVAFGRGLYKTALTYAQKSLDAYEESGDPTATAIAQSNLGLMYVINYDMENAWPLLQEADDFAIEHNFAKLSYYNGTNWILARRMKGYEYARLETKARDWIRVYNDSYLAKHLEFVLTWDGFQHE